MIELIADLMAIRAQRNTNLLIIDFCGLSQE